MANKTHGSFPAQLNDLDPDFVSDRVSALRELASLPKPITDQEIMQRIDEYFQWCVHHKIRPGVETMAQALHVFASVALAVGERSEMFRKTMRNHKKR